MNVIGAGRGSRGVVSALSAASLLFLACSARDPLSPGSGGAAGVGGATATGSGGDGSAAGAVATGGSGGPGGAAGATVVGAGGAGGDDAATGSAGADATTGAAGVGAAGDGVAVTGAAGSTAPCPPGVLGHCNDETGPVDRYPGFTLALAEEFDQPIDLDNDPIWTWGDGGPPEGQTRFEEPQITFAGGQMILTAVSKNIPAGVTFAEPAVNQTVGMEHACAVASGELRTKYNNYRYGRYEAKFTAPVENGGTGPSGNFLSELFVFRTPKWKEWRELDVMLEANIPTKVAYNMVNANGASAYPGGDAGAAAPAGISAFSIQVPHTYAIEWTPSKVTWYVDGQVLQINTGSTRPVPTLSAKIMMNLWVFASAAAFGDPARNQYPFHSSYDYFRFYRWNQETMYPVADPKTLPLADVAFSRNNPNETTYP
jgi:hypothetical protein